MSENGGMTACPFCGRMHSESVSTLDTQWGPLRVRACPSVPEGFVVIDPASGATNALVEITEGELEDARRDPVISRFAERAKRYWRKVREADQGH